MPTKTTGFKSKIFVILKKEEELNGYTYLYIFHHMHCNNLPCEGSIFLHFFSSSSILSIIVRIHFCSPWKTRTCYNNNKNNHLYIPAALSFLFRLLVLLFFAHINRIQISGVHSYAYIQHTECMYAKNVTISWWYRFFKTKNIYYVPTFHVLHIYYIYVGLRLFIYTNIYNKGKRRGSKTHTFYVGTQHKYRQWMSVPCIDNFLIIWTRLFILWTCGIYVFDVFLV